eukprot:Nk52_evm7s2473 gene=Nk52_evmTU7s2473
MLRKDLTKWLRTGSRGISTFSFCSSSSANKTLGRVLAEKANEAGLDQSSKLKYLEQAANAGNSASMMRFGLERIRDRFTTYGKYSAKSLGIRHLEAAAAKGGAFAQFTYAKALRDYSGEQSLVYGPVRDPEVDLRKSKYYLEKSFEQGLRISGYHLGLVYLGGDVATEQDIPKALECFKETFEDTEAFDAATFKAEEYNTMEREAIMGAKLMYAILSLKEAQIGAQSKEEYDSTMMQSYKLLEDLASEADFVTEQTGGNDFQDACLYTAEAWIDVISHSN